MDSIPNLILPEKFLGFSRQSNLGRESNPELLCMYIPNLLFTSSRQLTLWHTFSKKCYGFYAVKALYSSLMWLESPQRPLLPAQRVTAPSLLDHSVESQKINAEGQHATKTTWRNCALHPFPHFVMQST